MPKLSTTKPQPVVPYPATPMEPVPSTSTTSEYQTEPNVNNIPVAES